MYRNSKHTYRGADKSLARPTSRCILFDGENISFDASLVIYLFIYIYRNIIYNTNIPLIMIINRTYVCLFVFGATAPRGPPISRGFYITHNDASQSEGLLWTSDQLVAETST